MNNIYENTDYKPPIGFTICIGTTAVKAGLGLRKIEQIYGITDPERQLDMVAIDASGITTTFPVPMLDEGFQHQTLGPNENLTCPLHDHESLQKAEKSGDIWFMPPDWHSRPGVARDNVGSGGNPRTGNALGKLNINKITKKLRNKLRLCQNYCRQREILHSSEDEKITSTPVTVIVCTSLLGGFGSGNTCTVLKILRQLERELQLQVRIVLLGVALGTLEPTDKITAARNQEMLLRQLDSCVIGQFKDIQDTSQTMQVLCDSLLLISNANNFGETDSIDKVISHVSNYIFTLFHTTLGNQVLERCVDIEENVPDDENGGKLWASTAAITKIHLDAPRIVKCVGYKLLDIFFQRILLDNHIKQAHKEADMVCSEQMLVENGIKSLASQRIMQSEGNSSSHAVDDTIRVFHDRGGSRGGYQGCCDMANASKYVLSTHIQRNVSPMITRQADLITENVKKALHNLIITHLQRPDGLSFTRQFLEAIEANIIGYTETNGKKLNNAQAIKKSIDDRLSHGHTLIKKLQCRNALFRFFSFGTKKTCYNIFNLQTEQAIKIALEIKARTQLANDVYPGILESITEKLNAVQKACENALEMKNEIKTQSKRLENFNPILQVPIGLELADERLINVKFNHTVETEGGTDGIFNNVFAQFQSNFVNLSAFNQNNSDQIKKILVDYCCGIAIRRLDGLNVIDALEEYAPTNSEKNRLIDQAIRESSGSIRTTGEGGRSIPTIKFIGTGDCHSIMWLEKMANNIDKTDGQWKSFETGDKNTIIFWQQRAQVSVSNIIKWTSTLWKKPENIEEYAKFGSCPVMIHAPTSCDNQDDLKSIAAMGLTTGKIGNTDQPESLYQEDSKTLNSLDFEEIKTKLQHDLPLRVDVYRQFVISITTDYKQIIEKLNSFINCCGKNHADLFEKIGTEGFTKTINIAKSLNPHLSRLPKDTKKSLELTHSQMESKNGCS